MSPEQTAKHQGSSFRKSARAPQMQNKGDKKLQRTKLAGMKNAGRADLQKREAPSDQPIEVTDATFKEVVQNHPLAVVDCWVPWCKPCNAVAPVIEELSEDYAGKILFGVLNVDENPKVSAQYGIRSIPTLLIFKRGKLLDRIIGAMPRRMLESKITQYL
jgi:thioredoxin 1